MGMPPKTKTQAGAGDFEMMRPQAHTLAKVASDKTLFDAHCHYLNYLQQTEGVEALVGAMDKAGIGFAVLTGTAFKKMWVGADQPMPQHFLYDDGDLYHYSMTDGLLTNDLKMAYDKGKDFAVNRFAVMACGFNLGDFGIQAEVERALGQYPYVAIGEMTLQSDDINNVTIKGGNWSYFQPAIEKVIAVCGASSVNNKPKKKLPFVFVSDARSISTKPYRHDFEYLDQIEDVAQAMPDVKCLWVGAGVFMRGLWDGYAPILEGMLTKYANLYISFTPEICAGKLDGLSRAAALEIAGKHPQQCCLGTTIRGLFVTRPPHEFGGMSYAEECAALSSFADDVEAKYGTSAAAWLRYRTAATVYNFDLPSDPNAKSKAAMVETSMRVLGKELEDAKAAQMEQKKSMIAQDPNQFISGLAYGLPSSKRTNRGAPTPKTVLPSRVEKKWKSIDCHLHLLDFLQKSSGTVAALKAMDGCEVERAVVFGMPCCKKWCYYRPEQPLYYQDDNSPCYVYAYADQMVADAWLALGDKERERFAPCFASFDPTDLAAISHVRRMYNKYPKMWRAVGEVMCRHDDLTTMLLGKEIPRINHPALDSIYEFCMQVDLPILVHQNADRVGDNDAAWSFRGEVEDVLKRYPTLKLVWVHAGVSRRCSEPNHYEMIDMMLSKYPNLGVDISWVVWEDVILDVDGVIKPQWVECIQKHNTRFYIGSDNVAQFFPIRDTSVNLLASNITKYWPLFDLLTPEAAENVSYKNAYRMYFDGWDVPKASGGESRYNQIEAVYETECLDPAAGAFVPGDKELDTRGKY
uniref:Amidohydrolase-related domain-containing protein n=1 Tax=Haptolina ericina TaxID=156174 RepID=A0A7S3F2G0_9EUKA